MRTDLLAEHRCQCGSVGACVRIASIPRFDGSLAYVIFCKDCGATDFLF